MTIVLSCVMAASAKAEPLNIPSPLVEWVPWVLHGQEQQKCPTLYNNVNAHRCQFRSSLELELQDQGGQFQLKAFASAPGLFMLPGGAAQLFPQGVLIDGKPHALTLHNGRPTAFLASGEHTITGNFSWERFPESLPLPTDSALVKIKVKGQIVEDPRFDTSGLLWLSKQKERESGRSDTDMLDVAIFRKLTDDIPFSMTTLVTLKVSGSKREQTFEPFLPAGFIPTKIESPLPTRLAEDGKLRVALAPGTWTVTLVAHHPAELAELSLPPPEPPLPSEEIWAFEAKPELRLVTLDGLASIDPAQTEMPQEWRSLPSYRFDANSKLTFTARSRGNLDPGPDQLALNRQLWLDFDGSSYTFYDEISGTNAGHWRLSVAEPASLGRVAIDGYPQLITKLPGETTTSGVEVRQGNLSLNADLRMPRQGSNLPAVGWDFDPQRLSATVHLPPGWRLLATQGVDEATGSWMASWNLMNVFLTLIVALGIGKLRGWRWSAIALACLVLTIPEEDAPAVIWLVLLVTLALLRATPESSKLRTFVRTFQIVVTWLLVLWILDFSIDQIRTAQNPLRAKPNFSLYNGTENEIETKSLVTSGQDGPTNKFMAEVERAANGALSPDLEKPQFAAASPPPAADVAGSPVENLEADHAQAEVAAEADVSDSDPVVAQDEPTASSKTSAQLESSSVEEKAASSASPEGSSSTASDTSKTDLKEAKNNQKSSRNLSDADSKAIIQTGPGIPRWKWESVNLNWTSPVKRDQELHLWLSPPRANATLNILRVILLFLLTFGIVGADDRHLFLRFLRKPRGGGGGGGGGGGASSSGENTQSGISSKPSTAPFAPQATASQPSVPRRGFFERFSWSSHIFGSASSWKLAAAGATSRSSPPSKAHIILSIVVACILLSAFMGLMPSARAAAAMPTPPNSVLDELRSRLLAPPACANNCASIPRMDLAIDADVLDLRLEAHALADTLIPLPGRAGQWLPTHVVVDGQSAPLLTREADGHLWLGIDRGTHQIVLRGPLPSREQSELVLRLKPQALSIKKSDGYEIVGVRSDGEIADNLVLKRKNTLVEDPSKARQDEPLRVSLPAFLRIERNIEMGLTWTLRTRVVRIHGDKTAVVMKLPMMPGERLTTNNVRAESGMIPIHMGPNDDSLQWSSVLDVKDQLTLTASESNFAVEVWTLRVNPIWHVTPSGIPPISHIEPSNQFRFEWRPWPKESVSLAVLRPTSADGRNLTLDSSLFSVNAGARSINMELRMALRTSRSAEYKLPWPKDAHLRSVVVDGREVAIQPHDGALTIPLPPGNPQATVTWQLDQGMEAYFRTPNLDLGQTGVNAVLKVFPHMPRWILFLGGPGAGPSIQFWSQVVLLIGLSWLLARLPFTPLRSWHWFLLGIGTLPLGLEKSLMVFGFMAALGLKRQKGDFKSRAFYNLGQVALVFWAFVVAGIILAAMDAGFFGDPQMNVVGNGSQVHELNWFLDRHDGKIAPAWIVSVPMSIYKAIMLAWALWFAWFAVNQARWAFESFGLHGLWRPSLPSQKPAGASAFPAIPNTAPSSEQKPAPSETSTPPKDSP